MLTLKAILKWLYRLLPVILITIIIVVILGEHYDWWKPIGTTPTSILGFIAGALSGSSLLSSIKEWLKNQKEHVKEIKMSRIKKIDKAQNEILASTEDKKQDTQNN